METFKKVAPKYEVSTVGNVKSYCRYPEGRLLTPHPDTKGYLTVTLYIDGEHKHFKVHRLVAMAFIPNPLNLPQVNHINGDKSDNRVENLEWCTQTENMRHALATGLKVAPQGEDASGAKLTNEQVIYIRDNPNNLTQAELGKKFGVDQTTISMIQIGKTFKNAGGIVRQPKNPRSVPDDVRAEIRRLYSQGGISQQALAEQFGIGHTTISRIIHEED